ncbi:MAG: 30S ribosomal protein S12 methylthiotransferase RimO [Clostridiales bacterium]|nr:30S ribosomal protein S12 methylthiotransferase RimO [Clostridiales bacterium]
MDILKKKIGFISLGCDKNRVDLEKMMYAVRSAGFLIEPDATEANIIIVNTCSFIRPAREESISAIIECGELKGDKLEKIIVTGCINEMQYTDLAESLPEVDAFVHIKDNERIVDVIFGLYNKKASDCCYSNHNRLITTPRHYAYLKISDGCNNFCSYCKIPYIRGRYKSESLSDLMIEAQNLVDNGATEIILVAQDVTKYGTDLNDGTNIVTLIRRLSKITNLKWIRLLYCYPESITEELIAEIRDNPKVCKYIDIPLQHVDSYILKQMNRRNNYDKIVNLIKKLRLNIPDIAIRTTFILGFPGERKEHFDKLMNFVIEQKLNYVGFFTYSREEGTRSYDFIDQVPTATKNRRLKAISEAQYGVVKTLNNAMLAKTMEVVIDGIEDDMYVARSQYHNPESDSVIYICAKGNNLNIGQYYTIRITNVLDYDLQGEIL